MNCGPKADDVAHSSGAAMPSVPVTYGSASSAGVSDRICVKQIELMVHGGDGRVAAYELSDPSSSAAAVTCAGSEAGVSKDGPYVV